MKSMPASSSILARRRLSSQLPDQRSGCFVIVSPLAQLEAKVPSLKAFPWCITLVASFISLFLRTPVDFPAPAVKRSGSTRAGFCSRSWRPGHLYPAGLDRRRSEERRVGKECVSVDLGGRRIIKKKKHKKNRACKHERNIKI